MKIFTILLLLITISCSAQQNDYKQKIIGQWCLDGNDVNHPRLRFYADSTALFTSRADTLYRYRYYVKDDQLVLWNTNRFEDSKILILTEDSLHFESLPETGVKQKYYRCKFQN